MDCTSEKTKMTQTAWANGTEECGANKNLIKEDRQEMDDEMPNFDFQG